MQYLSKVKISKLVLIGSIFLFTLFLFNTSSVSAVIDPYGTVTIDKVLNSSYKPGQVNSISNKDSSVDIFYTYDSNNQWNILGREIYLDGVYSDDMSGDVSNSVITENPGRYAGGQPYGTHTTFVKLLVGYGDSSSWITSNTVTFYTEDVDLSIYNNAELVNSSVPDTMIVGQEYSVSVTMKNTGTEKWKDINNLAFGDYALGSYDNVWGTNNRISVGSDEILPGAQKTFVWTVKAPVNPGTYYFQWKMLKIGTGWFGTQINIPVNVIVAPVECNVGPVGFVKCANGEGVCPLNEESDVAYGCNGTYTTIRATGNIYCNANEFGGDPLPGEVKSCFAKSYVPPEPFDYSIGQMSDYTIKLNNSRDTYQQGSILTDLVSGESQSVDFSLISIPESGVAYSLSNNFCFPPCATGILFTASPGVAKPGTYNMDVIGSPLNKKASFRLIVQPTDEVSVTCVPSSATPALNSLVTWTATVNSGVPPYKYLWSGTNVPTVPPPTTSSFNISYSTVGTKTASVVVTDSEMNTGTCAINPLKVMFSPDTPKFQEL